MTTTPPTIESIDLTPPQVKSGEIFRLTQLHGAFWDPRVGGFHAIKTVPGYMEFELTWPGKTTRRAGANFILRLCSATVGGVSDCPITVSVRNEAGEHKLVSDFDPHIDNWYNRAWYIPGRILRQGTNHIRFALDGGTTQVWIQRASIALFWNHAQENTNWCWSAVTSNVTGFYGHKDPVPQPDVIHSTWNQYSDSFWGKALKRKLGDKDFAKENLPWFAHLALKNYGMLRPRKPEEDAGAQPGVIPSDDMDVVWRPLTFEELQKEAGWLRPVVACIKWSRGGNHFIVLTGVGEAKEQMVAVQDPWGGEYKYIKYDTLKNSYNGDGRWFYTCFTRPPEPAEAAKKAGGDPAQDGGNSSGDTP